MLCILLISLGALAADDTATQSAPPITPPKVKRTPAHDRAINSCYARSALREGSAGRVVADATVGTDGRITDYELTPGIPSWQVETAACVMAVLLFEPGTRGGVPVEADVKVPLNFNFHNSPPLALPQVATSETEIEEIYRACYPPDQLAIAKPLYRVSLSATGEPRRIELVESCGVESLDRAGVCVLERLRFEPARRGKAAIETTAIMPILLRPPK
jgi:outer membrane biosynthesis protein TonB